MRKCPKCHRTYDNTWKICLYCHTELQGEKQAGIDSGRDKTRFLKKELIEKESIILYSILIAIIALLAVSIIYFTFFREMDRELRQIEQREYGVTR